MRDPTNTEVTGPLAWRTSGSIQDRLTKAVQEPPSSCCANYKRSPGDIWRTVLLSDLRELLHHAKWITKKPEATKNFRRVVCAAIRASDGSVLLGIRHYSLDMHAQIVNRNDGHKFQHRHDEDQGFVDQFGVYMTREEAYLVAATAGQIVRPEACEQGPTGMRLYSEGLY